MGSKTCSIPGCDRPIRARGWCNMHWQRWSKNGDPETTKIIRYATPEESFAANTKRSGDCIVWTASPGSHGYGRIHVSGKRMLAHRFAWEAVHGPIDAGAFIDHTCFNRLCVNVEHLRIATPAQNVRNRSGSAPGRKYNLPRNVYPSNTRDGRTPRSYYVSIAGRRTGPAFPTPEEAAEHARVMRAQFFGEFAGRG